MCGHLGYIGNSDMEIKEKRDFLLKLIIAICSVLSFLVILIVAVVIVPKAVRLMNTAQRTLDNIESVSEDLKALEHRSGDVGCVRRYGPG